MSRQTEFDKVDILGISVDCITPTESIEYLANYLDLGQLDSIYIVKPYVEFMTRARSDKNIRNILNHAELCLADGVSLQWAASFLYGKPRSKPNIWGLTKSLIVDIHRKEWREQVIKVRGAGVDVTNRLLKKAAQSNWRVGVISGKPKQAAGIQANLKKIFPRLNLVGVWPGYFDDKGEHDTIANIKPLNIDILFVARGFPLQEEFIYKYKNAGLARVLIGEGGTFDYDEMGGPVKRAPLKMRRLGLEWLWRLLMQPRRVFRMLNIPLFVWQVFLSSKRQK